MGNETEQWRSQMNTARRMIAVAADRPAEAVADVLGLAALCLMIAVGFAATAYM